jgi:hypothetical protein
MGLSWKQREADDIFVCEYPAPVKRLVERWQGRVAPESPSLLDVTPIQPTFEDLLAARDAEEYARPSQERLLMKGIGR